MKHQDLDRRAFLKTAAVTTISAAFSGKAANWAQAAETAGEIPMRTPGRTGLRVTMIRLGGYHAGGPDREEDSIAITHRALDLGINFLDNADCYQEGRADERMGMTLRGHRKNVYLMTKVDQRDAKGSREELEKSLCRLRTDYLGIWQFHALGKLEDLDKIFGPGGAMETVEQAKKEGKIRFIGVTRHLDPTVHFEASKCYPFDRIQTPINVADPHLKSFRKTVLDKAVKRHIGVIDMKRLSFGNMVSKGMAKTSEALPWV